MLAASVDGQGVRIITREAIPFGCFGSDTGFKVNLGGTSGPLDNFKFDIRYNPGK